MSRGWCVQNPASLLRIPKVRQNPALPFTDDELVKIRESVDACPARAFVLLLEHSALRISDVVFLSKEKIRAGKLFLRTAKTGQPVWSGSGWPS